MAFGSFENQNGNHTISEINMVPLIDVMLVLLVIFIITAPLLSHSIKINVPQATAQPVEQEPRVVDLAVDGEGQLFWNEQPVSMDQLKAKFAVEAATDPQPELRIRADLNTRYEVLAQVMSGAKASGLKRLGFITRPGSDTPAIPSAGSSAVPPSGAVDTRPALSPASGL